MAHTPLNRPPTAASLSRHDHPCLIYDATEELAAAVVPYLQAGLRQGERCVYFLHEHDETFILDAMAADGFDLAPYLAAKAFQVIHTRDAHLAGGYFDEPKMMAYWEQFLADAQAQGFPGLRAAVEMTWAVSGHPGCDVLAPYEARLNRFTDAHPLTVLCAYRRRRFAPSTIKGILHAHPLVMAKDEVWHNPHAVPPEAFVDNDADLDVQTMLDNLALIHRLQQAVASQGRP